MAKETANDQSFLFIFADIMAYLKIKMDNSSAGKKKNFRIGIILILFIMAVTIIPLIYSHSEYGMIREARSRYNSLNSMTSGYFEYLKKYPNGKYSKEATTILKASNPLTSSESNANWNKIPIKHITGEPTGRYILEKNVIMNSPTGVNGGKWNAKIKKETDSCEIWYLDFCPEPNMDRYKDHGNFLMLRYKVFGSKTLEQSIRLEFVNHKGYKFDQSFNVQLDRWMKEKAKVKFVGFTNDNPHITEFVSTPNGNGRKNETTWVCYSDPEFTIQF